MSKREPTSAPALDRLVDRLSRLPGVGRRSAHRIAFYLLKQSPDQARELADAIRDFTTNLCVCRHCSQVSELDPCAICSDPRRDQSVILVVEQPSDIVHFETLGSYRGLYHVLMGRLALLDDVGPGELNLAGLIDRVKTGGVREVILATNPTFEGDGTAMHLAQQLDGLGVTVTRLARGVPTGSSLEMVSKAVLADAVAGRQKMSG